MKISTVLILLQLALAACSSLDFFQYREDTGLYVLEKPDGYGTASFGANIATSGSAEEEYMVISGGTATSSLFYRLSSDGAMSDAVDYFLDYPGNATEFVKTDSLTRGSGAALAGLPLFAENGRRIEGCAAVGEPTAGEVMIWCSSLDKRIYLEKDVRTINNFGSVLSAIRLDNGTQFLLAVGGENGFQLFADVVNVPGGRSEAKILPNSADLKALAGGRRTATAPDGTPGPLYVVAGTQMEGSVRHSLRIYTQTDADISQFEAAACLRDGTNAGFGGVLLARDLDGDGAEELIVGSVYGAVPHKNEVRIYDPNAVISAVEDPSECVDISEKEIPTLAVLTPNEGDLDMTCGEDCGFGAALAAGDIATDDNGPELAVGAYHATVDGVSDAGGVYIYRGWTRNGDDASGDVYDGAVLASQVADSTPERGKAFGATVEIAPIAGRNELLIAATGEGKVFIAYCTGVGEDIRNGADTTRDGDGKVVSTRCRL